VRLEREFSRRFRQSAALIILSRRSRSSSRIDDVGFEFSPSPPRVVVLSRRERGAFDEYDLRD
jgi:hypothetical protein